MPAAVPFITSTNARALAALSWEKRRARKQAMAAYAPAMQPAADDPLKKDLARAMKETLAKVLATDSAKEKGLYARALRDLRETYHMVTGQSLPGRRKELPKRSGPAFPRVIGDSPGVLELPGQDTGNSGSDPAA